MRRQRSLFRRFFHWLIYRPNQFLAIIGGLIALCVTGWQELPSFLAQFSGERGLVIGANAAPPPDLISGKPSVIDGDTLEIHGRRIRLHGIDAPEGDQRCQNEKGESYACGRSAANALDRLMAGGVVTCREVDRDRYGRSVAKCIHGPNIDVGKLMVRTGQAMAFRRFSNDYADDEDHARRNRLGIWSGPFTPPWEYRASKQRR